MMRRAFRPRLSPISLGLLLAVSAQLQAQTQEWVLNIPAQPLSSAVQALAQQTSLQILYSPADLEKLRSNPLNGRYGLEESLEALLKGTGVRYQINGNTATLQVPSDGSMELSLISVNSSTLGESTENTGSYTTGTMRTATKLPLSIRETPQSVSVITRQQMDDQNITSVAGVLERSVGITLGGSETDRVTPRSRGFTINKIQYDGIPTVEDNRFDTDFLSDTAIYDRVEIVRGATGLLTGTGEPSAAINLVRKRPTAEFQGHVQASAGSWDTYRSEVDLSGPLSSNGGIRGRFVGTYGDRNSYLDDYDKDLTGLYGILEVDLPEDLLLTVGMDYQKSHVNGITFGSTVPLYYSDGSSANFSRSTSTGADWTYVDNERLVSFAGLEKTFANDWLAKLQYTYRDGEMSTRLMGVDGAPDRLTGDGVGNWFNSYDTDSRQSAVNLYATGPFGLFGRIHELVLGYSYSEQHYSAKYYPVLSSAPLDNFYDRTNYPEPVFGDYYSYGLDEKRQEDAVYLASRWHVIDPLKLIVGLRLTNTDYDMTFRGNRTAASYSGELTPYAGLVYELNENYSAYVSYTDIFQTQTVRDRDNVLLDPRTGTNYEAGIKADFYEGKLNLSAAVFKVEQDNLAERDIYVDGELRYKPIEGAKVRGYELEIAGELQPGWNVSGGFTRRIAKDGNGSTIQTVEPQNLLRLTSSHNLSGALSKFTVGGHVTWQNQIYAKNERPGGGDAKQESYALLHLFGTYRATEQLSLQANLNNVFDKVYYSAVGGYGKYGDPRSLTVTAKYSF